MKPYLAHSIAVTTLAVGVLASCGDNNEADTSESSITPALVTASGASMPVMDPGDGGDYRPHLDPTEIAEVIDNPYMPLTIGSRWRYEGDSDGEHEVIEVVVTPDRKTVMDILAFVVRDTVTVNGDIVEDTYDWYTQDSAGNVWYLGEETKEYDNGVVLSTEGSWEAGIDGGLPGIVMPAVPRVGDVYRQEYLAGQAEDMMQIIAIDGSMTVRSNVYDDLVITQDWTPLDPDVIEKKTYAPGVGMIHETKLTGRSGTAELVRYTPAS